MRAVTFSPDGSTLAFKAERHWSKPKQLLLLDLRTGAITILIENYSASAPLGWSPDGRQFVYESFVRPTGGGDEGDHEIRIQERPLLGRRSRRQRGAVGDGFRSNNWLKQFGQPEVQHLHDAVAADLHIRGLQVTMDDSPRVSGFDLGSLCVQIRNGYSCVCMNVCPTDIVLAPAVRIWNLLTDPRKLAQWTGTRLVHGPAGAMGAGDRLVLRTGVFRLSLEVIELRPPWQLVLDVRLPFGVMNHEDIQITPIEADSNRITFN